MGKNKKYEARLTGKGNHARWEDGVKVRYFPGDTIMIDEGERVYHVDDRGTMALVTGDESADVTVVEVNLDPIETEVVEQPVKDDVAAHVGVTEEATPPSDDPTEAGEPDEDPVEEPVVEQPSWVDAYDFTPGTRRALAASGLTADEVADSTVETLILLPGIGPKSAAAVIATLNLEG